jgi:hypothetical protein
VSEHSEKITGRVRPESEITGVRKLILTRARDMGLNLADLSRACDRNPAYIHQYIHKMTPRRLDEEVRRVLAVELRVDESLLRETPMPAFLPRRSAQASLPHVVPALAPVAAGSGRQVPLFMENEAVAPDLAQQWAPPFTPAAGAATCAVWIETPWANRVRPGDIIYAKTQVPTRPGDLCVILRDADNSIAAIGELTKITAKTIAVARSEEPEDFPRDAHHILKVVGILLP